MEITRIKRQWADGKPALNGWLGGPSPFNAEIMAHSGICSVTIDMQHGLIDFSDAVRMLTATKGYYILFLLVLFYL